MIQNVRCLTCGYLLGHVASIFRNELMKKIEEIRQDKNIETTKILTDPTIEIDLVPLLDALHIESDCCKMNIVTNMDIRDWY